MFYEIDARIYDYNEVKTLTRGLKVKTDQSHNEWCLTQVKIKRHGSRKQLYKINIKHKSVRTRMMQLITTLPEP